MKISNLVSQFSDGFSSAVLRDLLMQFNFFVMSTVNGKEKQKHRIRKVLMNEEFSLGGLHFYYILRPNLKKKKIKT